jgi:cell division protein FtsB
MSNGLSNSKETNIDTDYPYYKYIKSPTEIGMSDEGTLIQMGKDIDGLVEYVKVLVSGKSYASSIGTPLGNKYFISSLLFLIWMLFFNEKDVITEFRRRGKLNELQKSEGHLNDVIKETKQELGQLKNNAQTIEKYAREKYLMKKENEDLFIISSSDTLK